MGPYQFPEKLIPLAILHGVEGKPFVQDRPGHDRRYAINASRIERELSWRPLETFESGIRKTTVSRQCRMDAECADWELPSVDGVAIFALMEFEKLDHERISLPLNCVSNPERVYDADPINLSLLLQVF